MQTPAMAAVGLSPDLQKRVKIMAEHVVRNGPEFEVTVKAKNAGNPQFAFLAGGEGSEYYQQLLQAHRTAQIATAAAGSGAGVDNGDLAELVARWREPQVLNLWPEGDRQLQEIIASLEQIASRDAIRAGRTWIEANVAAAHAIAGNLSKKILYLPSCAHRLHVLFLLHDVLQTEVQKMEPVRPLATAFKPFLVWMLRPSYQLAQSTAPNGEESGKVLKLLDLWTERGILTPKETREVRVIITAKDLPGVSGAQLHGGVQHSPAPSLMQQVGAQISAQQAAAARAPPVPPPPGQPAASVLGILQQVAAGPRPAGPVLPNPNFSGVIRPAALPTAAAMPQQGSQTPETVPVGVMASMLKQVSKRGKDLHTAFVPYKPLDPMFTPQSLPPVASPTARLMERLAEYYDIVGGDAGRDEKVLALGPSGAQAGAGGGAAIPPPSAQPAAAPGEAAAPTEAPPGESSAPAEEPAAAGERKARRKICASGSRSRSRSRSASRGRAKAAAAALAGAAVPPPPDGPTQAPSAAPEPAAATPEAPKKSIQALD